MKFESCAYQEIYSKSDTRTHEAKNELTEHVERMDEFAGVNKIVD